MPAGRRGQHAGRHYLAQASGGEDDAPHPQSRPPRQQSPCGDPGELRLAKAETADEFRAAFHGRLAALTNVRRLFSAARWTGASPKKVVEDELHPYAGGKLDAAPARCSLDDPSGLGRSAVLSSSVFPRRQAIPTVGLRCRSPRLSELPRARMHPCLRMGEGSDAQGAGPSPWTQRRPHGPNGASRHLPSTFSAGAILRS
ncbi:HWE histidine kinase domain-containing protein [Bradyrhizobium pachyrhizi]|uniref:HWE histidine kinase domain-containing protein n=1 Tax=Bradyrhizobium pachyrhizi TaxID=280333 RepID=UPI0009E44B2B